MCGDTLVVGWVGGTLDLELHSRFKPASWVGVGWACAHEFVLWRVARAGPRRCPAHPPTSHQPPNQLLHRLINKLMM